MTNQRHVILSLDIKKIIHTYLLNKAYKVKDFEVQIHSDRLIFSWLTS